MKSTQIKLDRIGDRKVSTVFIEPFEYYEVAIWEPKDKKWVVFQSNLSDKNVALDIHSKCVQICEAAQRYEER